MHRGPDPDDPVHLAATLATLATTAVSQRAFREAALGCVRRVVPHDAAMFHALSPRVPLETGVFYGLDPGRLAVSMQGWDALAVRLDALRTAANTHSVARLDDVYARGTPRHAQLVRLLDAETGMRALCIAHLIVRDQVGGAVALFARRTGAFSEAHATALRALVPSLAVGDRLTGMLDGAATALTPTRLRCLDQRLTPRQREVVEYVALGCSNEVIATALGLSPHTVRNLLARVFATLGAANRADLVRLAVLVPSR